MRTKTHMESLTGKTLLILLAAFVAAGCGKDPNQHQDILLDFPSIMPERPIAIAAPQAEPWTSGRALAVHGNELFAVDTLNGNLVVLDRKGMNIQRTIPVGSAPEQVVVGADGTAYVSVRGDGEIVRIDAGATEVSQRQKVGTEPLGIALSPANMMATLFVGLSGDARVLALDPATLETRDQVVTQEDPRGLAASFNGFLVVTHARHAPMKIQIDAQGTFAATSEAALRRGSPSDHFFLPGRLNGLQPTRALSATVHPGTGDALVAHIQASPGTPDELFNRPEFSDTPSVDNSGYGSASRTVEFNIPIRPIETSVTIVTEKDQPNKIVASPPVQDPLSGEPMLHLVDSPSDINHHPTHTLAFITGEGSDNVLVINTRGADPLSSPLAEIKVGMAPKAVAFSSDGKTAYVLNGHSFTVSEIDITPFFNMSKVQGGQGVTANDFDDDNFSGFAAKAPSFDGDSEEEGQSVVESFGQELSDDVTQPITLSAARERPFGDDPRPAAIRRGQRVFTFARNAGMSHAGMFSCATCHLEGKEDKLTWIVPEGLRQTPSLASRLKGTSPFNWNGDNDVLQNNMVQTIGRLGGLGLAGQELEDLEQFLVDGLVEPKNPNVDPAGLTELQAQGKAIFEDPEVGCTSCHAGGTMVDGKNYDVGTTSELELEIASFRQDMGTDIASNEGKFNTPSLRGLWYTAPYLHDGSAATLIEVLDRTSTTMGKTYHLTVEEKEALVAYMLTL